MAIGVRHYGEIRHEAMTWLKRVEMDTERIDELPKHFSGGMQQRVNIAHCFVADYPMLPPD